MWNSSLSIELQQQHQQITGSEQGPSSLLPHQMLPVIKMEPTGKSSTFCNSEASFTVSISVSFPPSVRINLLCCCSFWTTVIRHAICDTSGPKVHTEFFFMTRQSRLHHRSLCRNNAICSAVSGPVVKNTLSA